MLLAIISGFLIYNRFDGRFGSIPLPAIDEIMDIHGKLGVILLFVFPVFALYSFHAGQKRLVQPDSLQKLTHIAKPIWWYTLHRLTNTLMLIAPGVALLSGRMMQDSWLPLREFNHFWYITHLLAWAVITLSILLHLLMIIKVGGVPLMLSIYSFYNRPGDDWQAWLRKIRSIGSRS
jgi:hypothetical protein